MKHAQARMMEAVVVIFIFFVLIVFGLIFYTQLQKSTFEEKKAELAGERAVSVSLQALLLPELRCTKWDNIVVKDCIDVYKLGVAQEVIGQQRDYYYDIFGAANVTVRELYPGKAVFSLYEQVPRGQVRKISTPVPVALYEPVEKKFSFGVMQVDVYS